MVSERKRHTVYADFERYIRMFSEGICFSLGFCNYSLTEKESDKYKREEIFLFT